MKSEINQQRQQNGSNIGHGIMKMASAASDGISGIMKYQQQNISISISMASAQAMSEEILK